MYIQKTSDFFGDFHRQFVEAFPQLTGVDPEAVQNHALVISTFVST